jgi:Na+/H+ antiporter NhaD/arsenite permease-like protein
MPIAIVWAVLVIFVGTYVLIAARRLHLVPIGRPGAALAGATAMVALSVVSPRWGLSASEAFAAIEPNTIGLLLGMMLLAASLGEAGFFELGAEWLLGRQFSPTALLYFVTITAGLLSALLVNDSVCLLLAPLVDRVARKAGRDRVPYLIGLAMGSNAGSALTLAGNPQNMLVAHLSGISYREYLWRGGPPALAALLTTAAVLHGVFRTELAEPNRVLAAIPPTHEVHASRWRLFVALACTGLASVLFLVGANLAWSALGAASLMMLVRGRAPERLFDAVGWTVLLFFGGLFIVVAGLQKTGVLEDALARLSPLFPTTRTGSLASLGTALVLGCQVVSNVPFILLAEPWIRGLPDPHFAWLSTALFSTLAGNLTLIGSVANIIVVEATSAENEIGFVRYLKAGVPVTLASSFVGGAILLALAHR